MSAAVLARRAACTHEQRCAMKIDEEDFLQCYVCGLPALWVIELAGEDEPITEEAACEAHSRGHVRRGLLTPPASERRVAFGGR